MSALHDQELYDTIEASRQRRRYRRRCVYCGGPTNGRLACRGHKDLPVLDPRYNPEWTRAAEARAA